MSKFKGEDDTFLTEHHPSISAAKPAWADDREDYIVGFDPDGSTAVHYVSPNLLEDGTVVASMFSEAVYDPETRLVTVQQPVLSVGIGNADLLSFASPEEARAAAMALTLAAERFEELR